MIRISWTGNDWARRGGPKADLRAFAPTVIDEVRAFHATIPGYEPTPLVGLRALAGRLGLGGLFVKDESYRFGLNAFKVLGGSYAIARLLAERLGRDLADLPYPVLTGDGVKAALGDVVFATTTDGNHGRGVAWAAKQVGQHAVVYMPKGSAQERVDHILNLGAECIVTDMNYDDTVRLTMKMAEERGWHIVQDTAWEGYTKIPT